MGTRMMFLDCPAYIDDQCTARCGLPAAVEYRYTVSSTDGPLESARIRCPQGHVFNGLIEALTWEKHPSAAASTATCTGHQHQARRPATK
jgi:hypothetical protein